MPPSTIFNVGEQLNDAALRILGNSKSCIFRLECRIFAETNEEVSVTPYVVTQYNHTQFFESEFFDKITCSVNISTEEAILLLTNYKDLCISFIWTRVEPHTYNDVLTEEPISANYRVIIANAADLLKQYSAQELSAQTKLSTNEKDNNVEGIKNRRTDLPMQLFTKESYDIRKIQFHATLKDVTVTDLVHYAANVVGIKKINMTKSDNQTVYSMYVIEPMQEIAGFIKNLQTTPEGKGIYQKGCCSFFTNGVLYVYPGYETTPETKNCMHLYRVPEKSYDGGAGYMQKEQQDYHILLNDKCIVQSIAEQSSANNGDYYIALQSGKTIDLSTRMSGRTGKIIDDKFATVAIKNIKQVESNTTLARYIPPTNNILAMSSTLAAGVCQTLAATWPYCDVIPIEPGTRIMYHYEDIRGYKAVPGIFMGAEYVFVPAHALGTTYYYIGSARIFGRLAVEPNPESISINELPSLQK